MKKIFLTAFLVISGISAIAQIPQKFTYQSVLRDSTGNVCADCNVRVKMNIMKGSPSGTVVYRENYIKRLDRNGLLSLEIGSGIPETGTFSNIRWTDDAYFLRCEYDPMGGNDYNFVMTQQIMSVPYALISDTAQSATVIDSMTVRYDSELARLDSIAGVYLQHLSDLNDSVRALPQNISPAQAAEAGRLMQKNTEILQHIGLIRSRHAADERNRTAVKKYWNKSDMHKH